MESRVVKRRLIPATDETGSRGARGRVPATEEDAWSQAGVYSTATAANTTAANDIAGGTIAS
jgi:hypothetical protein